MPPRAASACIIVDTYTIDVILNGIHIYDSSSILTYLLPLACTNTRTIHVRSLTPCSATSPPTAYRVPTPADIHPFVSSALEFLVIPPRRQKSQGLYSINPKGRRGDRRARGSNPSIRKGSPGDRRARGSIPSIRKGSPGDRRARGSIPSIR